MKQYHLSYEFMGEPRKLTFDNLFEFDQALSKAIDSPQVPHTTIDFSTTEKAVAGKPPKYKKRRGNGMKFKPEFAPKKE